MFPGDSGVCRDGQINEFKAILVYRVPGQQGWLHRRNPVSKKVKYYVLKYFWRNCCSTDKQSNIIPIYLYLLTVCHNVTINNWIYLFCTFDAFPFPSVFVGDWLAKKDCIHLEAT